MIKVWAVILYVVAVLWAIDAVAVFGGYKPNVFTMAVAFAITSMTVFRWASQAWKGKA